MWQERHTDLHCTLRDLRALATASVKICRRPLPGAFAAGAASGRAARTAVKRPSLLAWAGNFIFLQVSGTSPPCARGQATRRLFAPSSTFSDVELETSFKDQCVLETS